MKRYWINIDWQEEHNPSNPIPQGCRIVIIKAKDFGTALKKSNKYLNKEERDDLLRHRAGVL
jgi:hypothetical protein